MSRIIQQLSDKAQRGIRVTEWTHFRSILKKKSLMISLSVSLDELKKFNIITHPSFHICFYYLWFAN